MAQFNKVLCPIDFDQTSLFALGAASQLVEGSNGVLVLLHFVELPAGPEVALPFEKLEAPAKTRLEKLVREKLPTGVRSKVLVTIGDPRVEILLVAKQTRSDLIVMATHGRKGLRRLVLGSVAESVVREAPCPVLTIRPDTGAKGTQRSRLRAIEKSLIDGSTSL